MKEFNFPFLYVLCVIFFSTCGEKPDFKISNSLKNHVSVKYKRSEVLRNE